MPTQITQVNILPDEYWWGGIVQDGVLMPYNQEIKRDLSTEQRGNQSTPFLLSNQGRYIWSEQPFTYQLTAKVLEITASTDQLIVSFGHETLRGAFLHAAEHYFPTAGKYPAGLMFTAPQYNTWIEMMYEPTQEKVLQYAHALIENGFPPGVLIIDDNWQEDYGVWQFHPGRFPKPQAMLDELHQLGFQVMLWVCNFFSPDSLTGRTLDLKGYLVKTAAGSPAIANWWNGYSYMLDMSNPEAVHWFKEQLQSLTDQGVDGFKFDAGDMGHFSSNFVTSKPMTANEYSEAWAEIGLDYELNEYRACWKQGGKPLAQRLSDKHHSWEKHDGLGGLIPNGLAQGLLGYAFTCPDMIGGGEYRNFLANSEHLDMELIVRNAQCAALFPMMQFSVAPWRVLDEIHLQLCVEAAQLHAKFGPVILKLARVAASTGEPMIRSMEYVFPQCGYATIVDQFMLGDEYLVAPVLSKGATTRKIVFPAGKWIGDDKSIVIGPCSETVVAPLARLPWYQRIE